MRALWIKNTRSIPRVLSWGAKICGAMLFVGWVFLVFNELFKNRFEMPRIEAFYQAGALAVVFVGYLISRKHAVVGSAVAIAGTACFFAIAFATSGVAPQLNAVWFALPPVLTLAAWAATRVRRRRPAARGWYSV